MDTPDTFDRDPETGAPRAGKQPYPKTPDDIVEGAEPVLPTPSNPGEADEGGVKDAEPVLPTPSDPGDPSISIESINGEGDARPDRAGRAGGMIGEGGS